MTTQDRLDITDALLRGSRLHHVDLTGSHLANVDLTEVRITDSVLVDVEITGDVERLVVNGVDVAPLVAAERDRRDPERVLLRPDDADGYRRAWAMLEAWWALTVDRARRLPEEALHERVDGEWSFLQTLRHLVFATEVWVLRAVQGDPAPWHPLSLPFSEMPPADGVPNAVDARPTPEEVLALRADRQGVVRTLLAGLTDDDLGAVTTPVAGEGWPPPDAYALARCLRTVLNEEWAHRRYAERDLAVLERRGSER